MSTFTDTFDYSGSELTQNGWTIVNSDFTTDASRLTPDSGPLQNDISRSQPRATGVFELNGVQNSARFYGLRIAFISQSRSFRGSSNPVGYTIQFRQERRGEVFFNVRGGPDGARRLMTLDRNHGGDPHDIRIERDPDTYEFTVYYDGERVGSVVDDTFTESSYMALRFDGGSRSQFVGGVSTGGESSPPTPVIDPAQVCPVQTVFETGLGDDDRLDLVTGKDTAVLVYPDGENLEQLSGTVTFRIPDSPDSALEPTIKEVPASTYREIASRNTYPSDPGCPCEIEGEDEITAENYIALYSSTRGTGEKTITIQIDSTDPQAVVEGDQNTRSKPVINRNTRDLRLVYVRLAPGVQPAAVGCAAIPGVTPQVVPPISPTPDEFEELVSQGNSFVSATYPTNVSGGLFGNKAGSLAATGVPLAGSLCDYANLDLIGYLNGARAIGVVSKAYWRFHLWNGPMPGAAHPNFSSVIITVNNPVAVAHELGHVLGLHRETEEYEIESEKPEATDIDKTDGFWVDRDQYINCRRAFMESVPKPENRFDAWVDNKDESSDRNRTPEDCDQDGFTEDYADYDHLFQWFLPQNVSRLTEKEPDAVSAESSEYSTTGPEWLTHRVEAETEPNPADNILYIKGIVSQDGSVYPSRWYKLRNREMPATDSGPFAVRLLDEAGEKLSERSFNPSFGNPLTPAGTEPEKDTLTEYTYFSFPIKLPDEARTAEFLQDREQIGSFDIVGKLLRDAIISIPAEGYVGGNKEDVAEERQKKLLQIVREIRHQIENSNTRGAIRTIRQNLRPRLNQTLKDVYEVGSPLNLTRSEVFTVVDEMTSRLADDLPQADEYGSIFDPDALTTGDVVTTKVTSQEDTSPDAKAGVMVRNDIEGSGDARGYVICAVTPDSGFSMEWDSDGTGYLDTTRRAGETTYPCWLRLRKDGTGFVGSYSTDGEEWTEIASTTLPEAAATQDAGVFATSGTLEATSEVEFEAFSVDPRS